LALISSSAPSKNRPARWLRTPAWKAPSSVQEVKKRKGNDGYNVGTGEYEDLVKAGVVDPKKVTRTGVAERFVHRWLALTTECLITEVPEKEKAGSGRRSRPRHGRRHGLLNPDRDTARAQARRREDYRETSRGWHHAQPRFFLAAAPRNADCPVCRIADWQSAPLRMRKNFTLLTFQFLFPNVCPRA
jgi:hypothetical protein